MHILETGRNKYNVRPDVFRNVFNRASCTCSPFSVDGYAAAYKLYESLDSETFAETRQRHIEDIKGLISFEGCDRFDVFFAPSGSDLCYYPLLFSKLIHPERSIFNVITCPEELGSGSIAAFDGKFYCSENQFGESVVKGEPIDDSFVIDRSEFSARDSDGNIINHRVALLETIQEKYNSHSVIANLVIGSKSGIENNVSIVAHTPEDVLWTIDLCQFRASRTLINGLIGMNCCVMLTGSKFYQSPPFCAVLLVPKTVSQRFGKVDPSSVKAFSKVLSRHDIPLEFPEIREHLTDFRNYGLLLRWEAALAEMKAIGKLDTYAVNQQIQAWNQSIVERLGKSKYFKLMPGQDKTNKTIVSFRVKIGDDRFLNHSELTDLYRAICRTKTDKVDDAEYVLFGQPVKYGEKSFIRLALGSSDIRQFVASGVDTKRDEQLIQLIEGYLEENFC